MNDNEIIIDGGIYSLQEFESICNEYKMFYENLSDEEIIEKAKACMICNMGSFILGFVKGKQR